MNIKRVVLNKDIFIELLPEQHARGHGFESYTPKFPKIIFNYFLRKLMRKNQLH